MANDDGSGPAAPPDESIAPPAPFREGAAVGPGVRAAFEAEGAAAWRRAADLLDWARPYGTVLERGDDGLRWFDGGRLNASHNCLDRHLDERKNTVAFRWFAATGESRTYTYLDLHREVNELAAALRGLGVEAGDVVTTYMPVLPELPVTMLACARLGALHSVVYAGYSAAELAARIERTGSRYLVTCDGYYRRGSAVDQTNRADSARLSVDHPVETVAVRRFGDDGDVHLGDGVHRYDELRARHAGERVAPVERDAADPLFVIHTSGTTGEPTQVTHTTGGYLAHVAWTARTVLDLRPVDTCWCAADVAWITGHSYVVYGPLALGATTLLCEGDPGTADGRAWELVERNRVNVLYTAPTVIRGLMRSGPEAPASHDLSSLRLLGSVGEPLDANAWRWYHDRVGGGRCPVVDTWWQTETGGIVVSTLPGVDRMRPGAAGPPIPGVAAAVVDGDGEPLAPGEAGHLALTAPWPGMSRALARAAGEENWRYVTGDRAVRDADGYVTLLGRADDVVAPGRRAVGAAAIERAIVDCEGVAEAAVVESDAGVVAYVTTTSDESEDGGGSGGENGDGIAGRTRDRLAGRFGTALRPRVVPVPDLPKTHSGKIMRRLLAAIADGEEYGDTSALRNPETVGEIETVVEGRDPGGR